MMGKAELATYCFLKNSRHSWCKSGGEFQQARTKNDIDSPTSSH